MVLTVTYLADTIVSNDLIDFVFVLGLITFGGWEFPLLVSRIPYMLIRVQCFGRLSHLIHM